MARKNLIVVRAGDDSCHPQWMRRGDPRHFDLLVSYFGEQEDHFCAEADHYHAMAGPRWPAHHELCQNWWELIRRYDYVAFVCDDVRCDAATWNELFAICRKYRLGLAQPAIEGTVNYEITRPHDGCLLRFTNFVEIMCPVFSRSTLAEIRWSFGESASGWGLDALWPSLLRRPEHRLAIVDAVRVCHGRSREDGTLYSVLKNSGIDPYGEFHSIMSKYGLSKLTPTEIDRIHSSDSSDGRSRQVRSPRLRRFTGDLAAALIRWMRPRPS